MEILFLLTGNKYHKTICLLWTIITLLATLNATSQDSVDGFRSLDKTKFGPEPRGTIKTIEVAEDGDIIDCVDIYKQPALNDPLIKKDFKMALSKAYKSPFNKIKKYQSEIIQNWRRYGECPEGTIPIRRLWNNNGTIHRKTADVISKHEYAVATQGSQWGSIYQGAWAKFNVWRPRVESREFSLAQMWLNSLQPVLTTIECGWIVYPAHYHRSSETRLFTYWTRDGYVETGCYDVECPGFVQTSRDWTLGGVIRTSTSAENQSTLDLKFYRDRETSKWWLKVDGAKVGYFPPSTVPGLQNGVTDKIDFGGEITNKKPDNKHTSTEMGSGLFPTNGYGQASFIRNIKVTANQYMVFDASLRKTVTRPECYDLDLRQPTREFGSHFYFGGPGFSQECYEG